MCGGNSATAHSGVTNSVPTVEQGNSVWYPKFGDEKQGKGQHPNIATLLGSIGMGTTKEHNESPSQYVTQSNH